MKPIRGSLSRGISSARISRNSSATLSGLAPPLIPVLLEASVVGTVQRQMSIDHLDGRERGEVAFDLVHDPLEMVALPRHRGHRQGGPLPQILMVDLCHGDIELRAKR